VRSRVELISGESSRSKVFLLRGVTRTQADNALAKKIGQAGAVKGL
jgi:uncharacterized protein YggU (UPF0235/DUF167 family)